MFLFFGLLEKLIPLYTMILLGFLAGKYLHVKKEYIASLLIYFIIPVVIFSNVISIPLTVNVLVIPLVFFFLACFICLFTYFVSNLLWKNATRNLVSFAIATGNTGYFGLPVAISLWGNDIIGYVALIIIALNLYQSSLGFFILARGTYSIKASLLKTLKLPLLYAFILGILMNVFHLTLGNDFTDAASNFRGAFVILGMMMVGLALAEINTIKWDKKFLSIIFLCKFLLWPILMSCIIFLDMQTFRLFTPLIDKLLLLMSIVPLAADTVTYATTLKVEPEKASLAVFLTTCFALFYIPFSVAFLLK